VLVGLPKLDFKGTGKLTSLTLNNSQNSGGDYAGSDALRLDGLRELQLDPVRQLERAC
jgi:hypothetical protein